MGPVVILAAGEGERLKRGVGDVPKPLAPLLGLSLLERVLLTWREAGINEFYVVVGYMAGEVSAHAQELARRHGFSLQVVENTCWRQGNGTSVLAVKDRVTTPFFVSMVDHIFEPFVLKEFVSEAVSKASTVMAVDPRIPRVFDFEEATKVCLEGDRVVEIDKVLSDYQAVDMGLFSFIGPEIFHALDEAVKEGDGSLVGGIKRLVSAGDMVAIRLENGFWTDVDTPEGLEHARSGLLDWVSCSQDEGWVSRHLNRRFSRWITARLVSTSLMPNHISFTAFVLAVAAGCLFALDRRGLTILAAVLVQAASVIDGCDGEVARLKFMVTPLGAWWDTVLDRYADGAIVLGITWGYSRSHMGGWLWMLGLLSLLGFVLVSYVRKEYSLRFGEKGSWGMSESLVRRDLRMLSLALGGFLGEPFYAMIALALVSHSWIMWTFLKLK